MGTRYIQKDIPGDGSADFDDLDLKENKPPLCPHCMGGEVYFYPKQEEFCCNKCRAVVEIKTPDGYELVVKKDLSQPKDKRAKKR